ncbi:MAG: hypothetical protein AAF741_09260 [Bacteroidota bacterium]
MIREVFIVLTRLSSLSILIPLLLGIIRIALALRPRFTPLQKRILIYVIVTVFFEILAQHFSTPFWKWLTGEARNMPGAHVFTVVQFGLIVWIYKEIVDKVNVNLWWILIVAFAILGLYNGLYYDGFRNFNPTTRAVQATVMLSLIIGYFYSLLQEEKLVRLENEPLFWTSAGLLLYFTGNLLIFLVSNFLLSDTSNYDTIRALYCIHAVLNILLNISLAIALWIRRPT